MQPEAYEAVQGLSDLSTKSLQNDDVQEFDVRWDQALLSASDVPSDVILEGLYKSELQDSVQLQTVLAFYDQETVRNKLANKLFTIEDFCETSYCSNDETRISESGTKLSREEQDQESERKESLR